MKKSRNKPKQNQNNEVQRQVNQLQQTTQATINHKQTTKQIKTVKPT